MQFIFILTGIRNYKYSTSMRIAVPAEVLALRDIFTQASLDLDVAHAGLARALGPCMYCGLKEDPAALELSAVTCALCMITFDDRHR